MCLAQITTKVVSPKLCKHSYNLPSGKKIVVMKYILSFL
jgi:hypothetical protein